MTNVWIFQANQRYYEINKELEQEKKPEELRDNQYRETKYLWPVSRYIKEIKSGDIALLWATFPGSHSDQRGIFAILNIISNPIERSDKFGKYWINKEHAEIIKPRVEYKYCKILKTPFYESEIRRLNELSNLSIIRSHEGTNFRVMSDEWKAIWKEIKNNR